MLLKERDNRLRWTLHGFLALGGLVLLVGVVSVGLLAVPKNDVQSAGGSSPVASLPKVLPAASVGSKATLASFSQGGAQNLTSDTTAQAGSQTKPSPTLPPKGLSNKRRGSGNITKVRKSSTRNSMAHNSIARNVSASGGSQDRSEPSAPGRLAPGRLAIVIDDIGHSLLIVERFLALEAPLTFSILPAVPHARRSAEMIEAADQEYLIHLPMQPFDYPRHNPGPLPLLLKLSPQETERRLLVYLENLPGASGASNHMGSAYTYNSDRMHLVQTVLAERNLYFLNSRTSGTDVPGRIAQRLGYAYLERDVFLDHDPKETSVQRSLQEAIRMARRDGEAIAIGHPYPSTLKVLARTLPRLKGLGVRVVSLSDLLQ